MLNFIFDNAEVILLVAGVIAIERGTSAALDHVVLKWKNRAARS